MLKPQIRFYLQLTVLLFAFANFAEAQSGKVQQTPVPTPTPIEEDTERVLTEEVKINVLAFDENGKFNSDVKKEDLVINEDNVLHQAVSVRRIPANVLIVMDTGGEMRQLKSLNQTRATAKAIAESLRDGDTIAVMQYADKPEIIVEWTTDKKTAIDAILKKSNFGKRDAFTGALKMATDFLQKNPLDNKHLVLITDGTDTLAGQAEKAAAMRKLLATDINVHVISYTKMELSDLAPRTSRISNTPPPKAMPDEVAAQLPNGVRPVGGRIGPTINLDREMLKKLNERKKDLADSEKGLSDLADNTNGEFLLPETTDEMLEKSALVARMIDASYVVTYVPKRPLGESRRGEQRSIEITSRRDGLQVQARRKLLID